MTAPRLLDRSGASYPFDVRRWRGDDGSPLMCTPLNGITTDGFDKTINSQWRYAAALPEPLADPVTLGEGRTPMLRRDIGIPVHFKLESANPTGSFKDRGVSVMITGLRNAGIVDLLEDSSGNGGSSVAAYCAAAGLHATILAPASTSEAKILQSRLHGADIALIAGTRQDTAEAAVRRAADIQYASHNWHPLFLQGVKLLAYELFEDLDYTAPDVVVVPAGAGSLVLGCLIGFTELLQRGMIDRIPRIVAVQPRNCSPLAAAMARGHDRVTAAEWPPTIAEGTAIARPVRDREVVHALRASAGTALTVTERDIIDGASEMAKLGMYVEPTSAMVLPALRALIEAGSITSDQRVVAVLTGSGHKAGQALTRVLVETSGVQS